MEYNAEQKSIIECEDKYQQVIAAAGSGKTSTMVALLEKILKDCNEKAEEILVITFSRKAAGEIRERLEKRVGDVNLKVKTFHAYCLYAIQKFHPDFRSIYVEVVEPEEREKVFKEYFKKERFRVGGIPYQILLGNNSEIQKEFSKDFADAESKYVEYKKAKNKLDFDDLIKIFLTGLRENSEWVSSARKEVQRVIVDEFQDTDMDQLEILRLLNPEKLTVVGDDWQAIYGFRGASTEPFINFSGIFSPCKVHFLRTNYRSLSKIIEISKLPIVKNKKNIKKIVRPHRNGSGFVNKIQIETDGDLFAICEKIHSLKSKGLEVKILCRSNFRIGIFRKAGISEDSVMTIHASKGLEFHTVIVDLCAGWNLTGSEKSETME